MSRSPGMPANSIWRPGGSSSRRCGGRSAARPLKKSSLYRRESSMWSPAHRAAPGRLVRSALAIGSAGLLAACFQPLYGQPPLSGAPTLGNALAAVDVQQIDAPRGSGNARIAVELRNALLFDLTGGAARLAPPHPPTNPLTPPPPQPPLRRPPPPHPPEHTAPRCRTRDARP